MATFAINIDNKDQLMAIDNAIYYSAKHAIGADREYLENIYQSLQDNWNEIIKAQEEEEYLATK